jgi:hypothetical protein
MATPIQWLGTGDANDTLVASADPHMLATYQIYKIRRGKYEAVMWDGHSLILAVHIADAPTLAAAKRACELHFATGEAQQRLDAAIEAERQQCVVIGG